MFFSIIIPVYNSENTIRHCLDSILSQQYEDFEIVIINDGSTDSTPNIISEYSKQDNRVKFYNFNNAGVSFSRQRGISLSSGKYLLFVDSDDTVESKLLQVLYDTISKFNNPDIIRYQATLINDSIYKDHNRYNYNNKTNCEFTGIEALKMWSIPNKKYAVYWVYAFKKSIFSNVLFVPPVRCHEDVALIPILIASSQKVVTIDYTGYNYLCNNKNSLTNTRSKKAEKSRAIDFVKAYHYAIDNFKNLPNVSTSDLAFFLEDYTSRLREKFNSLDDELKSELYELFKL